MICYPLERISEKKLVKKLQNMWPMKTKEGWSDIACVGDIRCQLNVSVYSNEPQDLGNLAMHETQSIFTISNTLVRKCGLGNFDKLQTWKKTCRYWVQQFTALNDIYVGYRLLFGVYHEKNIRGHAPKHISGVGSRRLPEFLMSALSIIYCPTCIIAQ